MRTLFEMFFCRAMFFMLCVIEERYRQRKVFIISPLYKYYASNDTCNYFQEFQIRKKEENGELPLEIRKHSLKLFYINLTF